MSSGSLKKLIQEIKMFLQFNENESTIYQSLWDTANSVLKEKVHSQECIY
jgi:hypothetical protein